MLAACGRRPQIQLGCLNTAGHNPMFNISNWLRTRSKSGQTAAKLYGSIVAQARHPAFYLDLVVPDTTSGRYEVLVLHLAVVLLVLNKTEGRDGPLGRALTEAFVVDMDDSLRQLAVGDMGVPRKVKKAAAGLMERTFAYRDALDEDDDSALIQRLSENLPRECDAKATMALAGYMRMLNDAITTKTSIESLRSGEITFPDPSQLRA